MQTTSTHAYEDQFSPEYDIADAPAPERTIIIASTPRSGSHMLGHAMTATDAMGRPFEYSPPQNAEEWQRRLGQPDMKSALREIMKRRTTRNGVFAAKLHYEHLSLFGGLQAALDFFPNPVVVRVVRADLLRQAISLCVARQTGVWISSMTGNGKTPVYDYEAIRAEVERVALHNALWDSELAAAGVPALTVEFEASRTDTANVLRRIADFAGIDLAEAAIPDQPRTRKQSGGLAEKWIEAYREDLNRTKGRSGVRIMRNVLHKLK
ncbi:Stf0 family sulfotransferase [Pseudooceanicola sediminis]|nr:Stf0 family sulfotransferase [Pseudooceanicola sediminis]|tara:strand:- start:31790 stop:32587 length:798 start_codon:yes stop_codon:yes gene_type:complete